MVDLNLDMDGVLANFRKAFIAKILKGQEWPHPITPEQWQQIADTRDFYYNLEPMPDMHQLVAYCRRFNPRILTKAHSLVPLAAEQKRAWIRRHVGPDLEVLVVADKHWFAPLYNVLVDDSKRNCDQWAKAFGAAILHHSAAESIGQLKRLGFV